MKKRIVFWGKGVLLALLAALLFSGCAARADIYVHNQSGETIRTIVWSGNTQVDSTTTKSGYYATMSVPKGTYDLRFYESGSKTPLGDEPNGVSVTDTVHVYLTSSNGTLYYEIK